MSLGRCHHSPCWSWWWWPSTGSAAECRTSCPPRPSPRRSPDPRRWASPCWLSCSAAAAPWDRINNLWWFKRNVTCDCFSKLFQAFSALLCAETVWKSSEFSKFERSELLLLYIRENIGTIAGLGPEKQRMEVFREGQLCWGKRAWRQSVQTC